jgi:hypothetical protein
MSLSASSHPASLATSWRANAEFLYPILFEGDLMLSESILDFISHITISTDHLLGYMEMMP